MGKFTWGDTVTIKKSAPEKFRPGQIGAICGFTEYYSGIHYTVEYLAGPDEQKSKKFFNLYDISNLLFQTGIIFCFPGEICVNCGFKEYYSGIIYTVEYLDGSDEQIAEEYLQLYEYEDFEFNQDNFADWPLHDAGIEVIEVDLARRIFALKAFVFYNPNEHAVDSKIQFIDISDIQIPFSNPWGSSRFVSIVGQRKEEKVFVLELQTGDEITVHAKWAIFEKVLKA